MIPLPDLLDIVGIALLCAVVVGAIGLLCLRFARRSPLMVQLLIVVLTAMLSVTIGMIAVAQAMYLSPHDLLVGIWVAGSATMVSLAAAVVLGRTFTRQAAQLRRYARDLGDGEHVEPPASFDRSELANLQAELARTGRRLEEARAEVEALDSSRRELVAWISHDLRTPLAGLRAMAEALEDGMTDDPQRFHRQMRTQVGHLSALVDELFELSKIQSGRLSLSREPVSLYDLVSDAVAELRTLAQTRRITIRESPSPDLTVVGDARELARVVGNLLMNAIQHSPPGSEISVATRDVGDGTAMLSVVDAGGGIAEADMPKIFLAGWRADSSRTPDPVSHAGGAGLGLAIAHGIVKAHEGDISARNVPGGCQFDVILPRMIFAS
ncbi:HAMP domain-containing histidine kinase [Microbacterium sp. NEAU-LLC]|uniref:Sensor-like histidine kinase SenX3 n=1 Tax=Microbacterium helvum TaxID=2773713 RepID=A0ABR8NIH8_9MICO|nr:HAMP domain-containing sensor histidine kinase [Microbacterium helvum]MBD3940503.1 HAMP domain-containing histidine kinase [Microbacterium helvum]